MMIHPPSIVLLGAPGTGAQALCAALQQRLATQAVRIAWSHTLEGIAPAVRAADAGSPLLLLLMGLDQPCPDSDRPAQEAADASLRAALARSGAGYQVVYGQGEQRVASALNALKNIAPGALPASDSGGLEPLVEENPVRSARLRAWNCEKCSDPECEHRLFTALTGRDSQRG